MKKTFKKVLSVVLALAMVVTSITVYNATAKAVDAETVVDVNVVATKGNYQIDATWSHPEGLVYERQKYYLNKADNIVEDEAHYAKAANDWVWSISSPTEIRTGVDTVKATNDNSVDLKAGGDFVITVVYLDAEGVVVARGTSNVISFDQFVVENDTLNFRQTETADTTKNDSFQRFAWDLVTGAKAYKVQAVDPETGSEIRAWNYGADATKCEYWCADVTGTAPNQTYNMVLTAYDAANGVLSTETIQGVVKYYKEVVTTTEGPATKPDEHDLANVDTSSWTELQLKAGDVDKKYSINTAASEVLSHATWWGIYAPHSLAAYHAERTDCILGDATSFTFQIRDIDAIWINGIKYGNHSIAFNDNGDCCEISMDILTEGQNVITLVAKDGTLTTFAIKVESDQQEVIDPETITDWTRLTGFSMSGSMAYISAASGNKMGAAELRGFFDQAKGHYNISDTDAIAEVPVFAFVANNANPASIVIDGVKYSSAASADKADVRIASDCVYIAQSLIDAAPGETKYYTITAKGSQVGTFLLKVVGLMKPTGVTATSTEAGKINIVWEQNTDMAEMGYTYNVYLDNAATPVLENVAANSYTIDAEEGSHTVTVKSSVKGNESDGVSSSVTVQGQQVVKHTVTVDGVATEVEENSVYILGDATYGYYADGKMYKAGTEITVTSDMTFTSVNTLSVTMANGAGIRYQGTAGIRFQAAVVSDNAAALADQSVIKEGTLITAEDIYEANGSSLTLTSAGTKVNVKNTGWYNDSVGTYCGSLCNIVESNYIREFTAVGYVTVEYADGTSTTVYSAKGPVRSISQVATAVKADGYRGIDSQYHSVIDSFIK